VLSLGGFSFLVAPRSSTERAEVTDREGPVRQPPGPQRSRDPGPARLGTKRALHRTTHEGGCACGGRHADDAGPAHCALCS